MPRSPPGFAAFRAAYEHGRGTLVWRRGVADLETPVAAFLKLAHGKPNAFLLESVEGGAARGRYSIIGMEPDLIWRCRGGQAEINRHARSAPHAFAADDRPRAREPARADRRDAASRCRPACRRCAGGLVGYLGYDMVRLMERLPEKNRADPRHARGGAAAPDAVRDLRQRERRADPGRAGLSARRASPPTPAWEAAQARLAEAEAALDRPLPHAAPPVALPALPAPASNFTREDVHGRGRRGEGVHRAPATPSRSCRASASRCRSRCRPSRCIARCAGSTRRRSCSFSISAASPSWARSPEILVRLRDGIGDDPPAGRHPPARRDARGGQGAGGRAAGRPEGARRAPDAARPRAQRCRAGSPSSAACG